MCTTCAYLDQLGICQALYPLRTCKLARVKLNLNHPKAVLCYKNETIQLFAVGEKFDNFKVVILNGTT